MLISLCKGRHAIFDVRKVTESMFVTNVHYLSLGLWQTTSEGEKLKMSTIYTKISF